MTDSIPLVDPSVDLSRAALIHPTACVYGNVTLGEGVSLWPYVSIRTELGSTRLGAMTNIQDFVMIHGGEVKIGAYCSITHHCTIHVCEIGDNCLVGINTTIMDGAVIGENCIIAGGTFITEGTVIPPNSIVMGAPGRVRKTRPFTRSRRMTPETLHLKGFAGIRAGLKCDEFTLDLERLAGDAQLLSLIHI